MLHRRLNLIGYLRTGDCQVPAEEQQRMMIDYCTAHNYRLVGFTETDKETPSFGLKQAMDGLELFDGIMALDIDRFVKHKEDRLRDLRPVISDVMHNHKVLITLADGVETVTPSGQETLMQILTEWSEHDATLYNTRSDFESTIGAGH